MDDPKSDNENRIESESEDNPEEESLVEDSGDDDLDTWNLNYNKESEFWNDLKNKGFIYIPEICPTCNKGKMEIKKYFSKNIVNPYYIRCNYSKCRKKNNLRTFSFMNKIKNLPASIIFEILENFFIIGLNANKIYKILKEKYSKEINERHIQKILEYFREIIFIYMKIKYDTILIGGFNHEGLPKIVAIDESLFIEVNDQHIWVIGGSETKYKKLRLTTTQSRVIQALEKLVNDNFMEGTHFTHDGWTGYNFLNNNINYTHESHNHGNGDFGEGYHWTSHIESVWGSLKN